MVANPLQAEDEGIFFCRFLYPVLHKSKSTEIESRGRLKSMGKRCEFEQVQQSWVRPVRPITNESPVMVAA